MLGRKKRVSVWVIAWVVCAVLVLTACAPAHNPTLKSTHELTTKPTTEPTTEPTTKPTTEPTTEPTVETNIEPSFASPQDPTAIRSPIDNLKIYRYSDPHGTLTAEEAAKKLAEMFMDDLCTFSSERTFRITEYRNLSVEVVQTTAMSEFGLSFYNLSGDKIGDNKWIVDIYVEFKYKGFITPLGHYDDWVDILYEGEQVGFSMIKEGSDYTFQSRL